MEEEEGMIDPLLYVSLPILNGMIYLLIQVNLSPPR